jgi:hypothetical protein
LREGTPSPWPGLQSDSPSRAAPSREVERAASSFGGSVAGSAFQLASFRRNNYLSPANPEAPEAVDSPSRRQWWVDAERRAGQISGFTRRIRNSDGSSSGSDVAAEDLVPDQDRRNALSILEDSGPFSIGNFRGMATPATPHRRPALNPAAVKGGLGAS